MSRKTLGKYEVVERIGRGGMAEVYRGYHAALDRYVAIKLLHPFLADDPEFKDRFEKEAKNVAKLRHPNIVQVFDFEYDDHGESYYMVMELINGPTLKDLLFRHAEAGQAFSVLEAVRIISDTANALSYAHKRSMIHRDIKPANIMVDDDERVVLTDFGIAKIVTGAQFTASGGMVGTPAYMAPEQGLGEAGDERSDIYSMGVMLYQMVTGHLPFDADTPLAIILKHVNDPLPDPREFNNGLSPWLVQLLQKALEKDVDKRVQTATEFLAALQQGIRQNAPVQRAPLPVTPGGTSGNKASATGTAGNQNKQVREKSLLAQVEETSEKSATGARPRPSRVISPERATGKHPIATRPKATTSSDTAQSTSDAPHVVTQTMPQVVIEQRGSRLTSVILALLTIALVLSVLMFFGQDGQGPFASFFEDDGTNGTQSLNTALPVALDSTTATPTETPSATATDTLTATTSPSPTATATPTPTVTPSPTSTHTDTATPTYTLTPSLTPSNTPTLTSTPDATQTISVIQTATQEAASIRTQTIEVAQTATQDAISFATQTLSVAQTATQDAITFAIQTQDAVGTATQAAILEATASAVTPTPDPVQRLRLCDLDYVVLEPDELNTAPELTDNFNPRLVRVNTEFSIDIVIENASDCVWPEEGFLELVYIENTTDLDEDDPNFVDYEPLTANCSANQPIETDVNFTLPQRPRLLIDPQQDVQRQESFGMSISLQAPATRGCYFMAWQLQFTDYEGIVVNGPLVIALQVFGGQ